MVDTLQTPPPAPKKKLSILRVISFFGAGIFILVIVCIAILSFSTLRTLAIRTAVAVLGAAPKHDSAGLTNILLLGVGDKKPRWCGSHRHDDDCEH